MDKQLIRSNISKSILGAYEYGNSYVLDYALKISTPDDRRKALSIAIMSGADVDYSEKDNGDAPYGF